MPKSWYYDPEQKLALTKFPKNYTSDQMLSAYENLLEVEDKIRPRVATDILGEDPEIVVQEWIIYFLNHSFEKNKLN